MHIILGQDILWPVVKRYPPPALAVPQEGIVKMIMGSPRAHDDNDYAILDRGAILRGHNEFGERVEFITDHQARFSLKDGVGFARVTAARSGDLSHMEAGTIGEAYVRARGVDTVTNPLPTWDPGTGPPKGDLPGGSVTRLWSVHLGKREPMVAMAGDTVLAAVNKKLYAFDMEGNVTHDIDIGLLPYYLCIKDPE